MTKASTQVDRAVGIILHVDGTLRIFENTNGRMYVEVVGFQTDRGRAFLGDLGQLEDIGAEILVCENPKAYGCWGGMPARLHWRRNVAGAGADAGAGTGARPAPLGPRP